MEQGKKQSQTQNAETFAFIAILAVFAIIIILMFSSCSEGKAQTEPDYPYILIDDHPVEMVADKADNQYLKYIIHGQPIYIPFPFETEEEQQDSLHFYQAKTK